MDLFVTLREENKLSVFVLYIFDFIMELLCCSFDLQIRQVI